MRKKCKFMAITMTLIKAIYHIDKEPGLEAMYNPDGVAKLISFSGISFVLVYVSRGLLMSPKIVDSKIIRTLSLRVKTRAWNMNVCNQKGVNHWVSLLSAGNVHADNG